MKINKIGAVALLALVLLSCRSEAPKEAWRKMDYPVLMSIQGSKGVAMRAEQKGTSHSAALANECTIENLTVVAFTNRGTNNTPSALEKVVTEEQIVLPAGGNPYNGKISFKLGLTGTYHLEVIANAYPKGNAAAKKAFLAKLHEGMSYDEFKTVLIDRTLPAHGESGFVMSNAEPIKVTTQKRQPADAGKIVLSRLACRFDLFNKLPEELSITKVTLQNQVNSSYLFTQVEVPSANTNKQQSYTPNGGWFTATVVTGGIYSYENPLPGATKLLLEGTYKGQPWQKLIEFKNIQEIPIATKRNHLYRIYLTKGDGITPGGTDPADPDKVHYGIEVLDWNDELSFDYTDADVLNAEQIPQINPLQYVAEYNINRTGDGFVTNLYATNVSGYWRAVVALAKFGNFEVAGESYHLPSWEEWKGIAPTRAISFTSTKVETDVSEPVLVAGEKIECKQDVKGTGNDVCYALRFKETHYRSAWKYEFVIDRNNERFLRITSRNVSDDVTINDIATEAFWQQNSTRNIVRIFPFSGYIYSTSKDAYVSGKKTNGRFWCPPSFNNNNIRYIDFNDSGIRNVDRMKISSERLTVRLFKGAGQPVFPKYSFTADRRQFSPTYGGSGKVTGSLTVYAGTNASGTVLVTDTIEGKDFTLSLKSGDATQITVDDANKTFTVKPGNTTAVFTLTAIPKDFPAQAQDIIIRRCENPLAYVAEYNINKTGDGFVTDKYATNVSGYYNFDDAIAKFSNIVIDGEAYYLPSFDNWQAIIPRLKILTFVDGKSVNVSNYSASVEVAGKKLTCLQDFKSTGANVCYALRFKGTQYQTAWKYDYVEVNNGAWFLRISSRIVDDGVTIDDVAKESFWSQNSTDDIVRIFPVSGAFTSNGKIGLVGREGYFQSCSTSSNGFMYFFTFTGKEAFISSGNLEVWGMSVRLFKDKL